jgi:hypothetical protein
VIGQFRQVWAIDEEISAFERRPDRRHCPSGERFERVAGVHDGMDAQRFEPLQQGRQTNGLSHGFAADYGDAIARFADWIQERFNERIYR